MAGSRAEILTEGLLRRALLRERAAVTTLVAELTPVVQARVGRELLRRARPANREAARSRVQDLTQDVFVELFRDEGRLLRMWDSARGLSLRSFVGLIAEQRVLAVLRSRKRSPFTEAPSDDEVFDEQPAEDAGPEVLLLSRESLAAVLDIARTELTPLGMSMFEQLVVNQDDVADVCRRMGMTPASVHAWHSRLRKMLRRVASELETGVEPTQSRRAAP
ncbi:MAG: sigma-70 family RNA polymerase sigma factor [Polyangiaceae bacterium]|nr:sigma-70 family RNA polymerase sigma factor [Polyangiaceae bacterium]